MTSWADPDPQADLEKLAAGLDGRAYAVSLVTGQGRRPHLHVTNRQATVLSENIYCDGQFYWWGWAERIAPVSELTAAVESVARVLRVLGGA